MTSQLGLEIITIHISCPISHKVRASKKLGQVIEFNRNIFLQMLFRKETFVSANKVLISWGRLITRQ